jgi:hypothetical protein
MGVQIEYPDWISSTDITSAEQCGKTITIQADGKTQITTLPEIKIISVENAKLFDEKCNPLFNNRIFIPSGSAPKEAFIYKIAPSDGSGSFARQDKLKIDIHLTDTNSAKMEQITLNISTEHPIWHFSRQGMVFLITTILIGGLIGALIQVIKDFFINALNPARKKK